MTKSLTPSEIARETLKSLAARKLVPTPANYARVYAEIGGAVAGAEAGSEMGQPEVKPALAWSDLIRDVLKQLETPHKGVTLTRKKDGIETVLAKFTGSPEILFDKLRGLTQSWSINPASTSPVELLLPQAAAAPDTVSAGAPLATPLPGSSAAAPAPAAAPVSIKVYTEMAALLRELLAQAIESSLAALPELGGEIQAYAQQARATGDFDQVNELARQLRPFWTKLELRGNDKTKIHEGLIRLMRLLVENVGELSAEDKWLHGQIITLQEVIAQPLDKRVIADAERNLRNAIIKQGFLKDSLTDAKTTLKTLMTSFVDRMGELTASTGEYNVKIESYSKKIGGADNITELSIILDDIMTDTRNIQVSALRTHEELVNTRKQAQDAEERARKLEYELEQVSEMMHEDQLTGALNRRGLDETLSRELKRADRKQAPVSLALIDIDNFKLLNDTLGHQAGDQALVHMTTVIKEALRPTDAVARYGGEEFLVIMPDTGLEEGMATITRLQREITKQFFLHNNKRLLITFSAGVALRKPGEDPEELIGRADKAMYHAKKTGKNRVVPAD
ncbi:MAG: GGDEF domain-containing protein [Pseudomonadota bacterium]